MSVDAVAAPMPLRGGLMADREMRLGDLPIGPFEVAPAPVSIDVAPPPTDSEPITYGPFVRAGRAITALGGQAAAAAGLIGYADAPVAQYDSIVAPWADRVRAGVKKWAAIGTGRDGQERLPFKTRTTEKAKAVARVALPGANMAFGEAVALAPQGVLQNMDAHPAVSFGAFMVASGLVEYGASNPIASHNQRVHPHTNEPLGDRIKRITTASSEAIFLGGSWGVQSQKLNKRDQKYPIAAYLLTGAAGLGAVTEYFDLAEKGIDDPKYYYAFIGALATVRLVNGAIGREGLIDRFASGVSKQTVKLLTKVGIIPKEKTPVRATAR